MSTIKLLRLSIQDTVMQSKNFDLKSMNWAQADTKMFTSSVFLADKLSSRDFRILMPFILTAIFERGASFEDSMFVQYYLSTPFYEFACRKNNKLSFLSENVAKHEFVPGWTAPSLEIFSLTELKFLVEAVDEWLSSEPDDVAWRDEVAELQRIVKMAVSDG